MSAAAEAHGQESGSTECALLVRFCLPEYSTDPETIVYVVDS